MTPEMATYSQIGKANFVHFLWRSKSPIQAKRYVNNTKGITARLRKMCDIRKK